MRHLLAALAVPLVVASLVGCDDPNSFQINPLLVADTVELTVPGADSSLPTALDIAVGQVGAVRGRFPERVEDAEQWDLAIRRRDDGRLEFAPAGSLGLQNPLVGGPSRAGVTAPLGQSFAELGEAPERDSFVTDSSVVIQQGAVYAAKSRQAPGSFGLCEYYAKLQPLEVQLDPARVRLAVVANGRCNDPRLVDED